MKAEGCLDLLFKFVFMVFAISVGLVALTYVVTGLQELLFGCGCIGG